MSKPTISFIVPTHPAWAPYALRFLRSLSHQTCLDFEVVFAVDGGDDGAIAAVAARDWPFITVVVDSPRVHGDFPHRNHARNVAICASSGRYLWVVDTDFIWVEHAVEHAVTVIKSADYRGEVIACAPVLKRIDMDPTLFLAHTAPWAEAEESSLPSELVGTLPTDDKQWDGKGELYAPAKPRVVTARVEEGFPLVHRAVLEALGLFDERFLRWGGNKIELCYRLTALAGIGLPYNLLASVAAWHQPHPQDPNKPLDDHHRVANHAMYRKRIGEVREGADWWVRQRRNVQAAIVAIRAAHVAQEQSSMTEATEQTETQDEAPKKAIGLLVVGDATKGIHRDIELIEECLRGGSLRRRGLADPEISRFTLGNPRRWSQIGGASLEGSVWDDWLKGVSVVVISEFLPVAAVNTALAAGVRVVYIPNADWAELEGSTPAWISMVRALSKRPGFEIWAKTKWWRGRLAEARIESTLIPWIALDPVEVDPPARAPGPVRFFASLGQGGYQGRRGADTIIAAWAALARPDDATLTIKSGVPLAKLGIKATPPGVEVIIADWTREQIQAAWADYDVVLYPTKWDGFGLSLSEALNAGRPVITGDAAPFNEQVVDGHNGILVPVTLGEDMRMAQVAAYDPADVAQAMARLIDDAGALARLTAPQPGERRAMQHAMRMQIRALLMEESTPSVLVIRGAGQSTAGGRRSELWWASALEAAGFSVLVVSDRDVRAARPPIEVDFCLLGKAKPEDVDHLRGLVGPATPIVCWHHDLTDWTDVRAAWHRSMVEVCDLTLVSEGELQRYTKGKVATVYPGHKVAEQRPPFELRAPTGRDVVFLGGCIGPSDSRVKILRKLPGHLDLTVYGPQAEWRGVGIESRVPVYGDAMIGAYNGAIAPNISRSVQREGYTSSRLFNAMAAGAVPALQDFPGHDGVIPPGARLMIDELAKPIDPERLARIQRAAVDHAWRACTWADRILEVVALVRPVQAKRVQRPVGGGAFAGMWEERAKRLGPRAVAHIAWDDAKFNESTAKWWKVFQRQIARRIKPHHTRILDYGCGVGRFTALLDKEFSRVTVGVDITPSMLAMARSRHPGIDFRLITPGSPLPFPDDSFDVVFTSTVLQHIPDGAEIDGTVAELRRVLRPGGFFIIFENCHPAKRRRSHSGHVVFRSEANYRRMFPGVVEVESWYVEGEKHAVLAGRGGK